MMTLIELENILIEYGAALRAIPAEVYEVYAKTHIEDFPNGQIVYLDEFKREMLVVKSIPTNAGKFVFEHNCGTGRMVRFTGRQYYNSIEEVIESLLRLEKPSYHNL
jgi:hypothetical protein